MAEDKRWWKGDKDSDTSKEDVEDLLNEAEAKRLQREEELAEAEHREKMAEFTDPAPSTMKESESGDGSTAEFDGQRIVLKPDRHGNFKCKGSIGNIANIDFLVDTGASFCSVRMKLPRCSIWTGEKKSRQKQQLAKGWGSGRLCQT